VTQAPPLLYLDASALVKLVLPEAESAALLAAVRREVDLATSVVGRIETFRAVLRASGNAELVPRIEETFRAVTVIHVTPRIRRWAETRPPFDVRTLDAIHLGTALSLGESLEAFVVYDTRLADAARREGLAVLAPAPTGPER
jgi:predicted nucleic acid-binding protein